MDRKDQISQVNAARANKLTFAAQHAFHDFIFQVEGLSPLNKGMYPADVEAGEMARRTGCRAAAAPDTQPDGGFHLLDKPGYFPVDCIEIYLAVPADRVSKGFHAEIILNKWQPGQRLPGHP